jgi:uncharacterized membrane protein
MESKVKLLGHPVHPMLIVLPLGLLSAAVVFDVVYLIVDDDVFSTIAFWNMGLGIVGGLLAAIFGLIDWLNVPGGTRAKRIGLFHGGSMVVVVSLFAISWLIRLSGEDYEPSGIAYLFSFVALALAVVAAWLGGELVDRLGVGVDEGANLDAPSSLTGEPASQPMTSGGAMGGSTVHRPEP